ncbi:hypothetical protein [uncultured Clostridium sp.]|uniref:hypothetical protein n=1 Tax=uncultured Clostridium sp. TaxID=59620 RepID=UPI0025FEAA98|nr:hypothetical protein [uncultured Clostridium sp.]
MICGTNVLIVLIIKYFKKRNGAHGKRFPVDSVFGSISSIKSNCGIERFCGGKKGIMPALPLTPGAAGDKITHTNRGVKAFNRLTETAAG